MSGTRVNRRFLSMLMAIVMMLTVLPVATVRAASTTVAEWKWDTTYTAEATGGMQQGKGSLTCSQDKAITFTKSDKTIWVGGWNSGEEYWKIVVPKEGYKNLELSFGCYGTQSSPRDFAIQVSTDDETYKTVKNYKVPLKADKETISTSLYNIDGLDIDAAEYVYIKLVTNGTTAINGGAVDGNNGNSRLYDVVITATEGASGGGETQVSPVTASIPSGATVEVGTEVDFTTTTTGSAIQLDVNGKGIRTTNTLTLVEEHFTGEPAKATVTAYATKDGLETSLTSTFEYFKKVDVPLETMDIATARKQATGNVVIVEGTVTKSIKSSATNATNCTIYVQDHTGGIAVYKPGIGMETYPDGTKVRVEGKVSEFNGVVQIQPASLDAIKILDGAVEPRVPEVITLEQLLSLDYEGKLVQLVGVVLDAKADNSNHSIKDATTGKTTTMRCAEELTLPDTFTEGEVIDAVGIAANFKGSAQLLVGKVVDITKGTQAEVANVVATPETGSQVPLNGIVTLATSTPDAHIIYRVGEGESQTSLTNTQEVKIESFDQEGKVTIRAKATNGNYTTPEAEFVYIQAKVEKVTPSVPVGAIDGHSQIGLSTTTHDATITYILTTNVGLETEKVGEATQYVDPIALEPELFPVKITAWAEALNYLESEKVELNYRLKPAGGDMQNYFGQLHSHTAENSDGQGTLAEGFAWARDEGNLDFFAITDHSNSFDKANTGDKAGTYNLGSYNASNEKWQNGQRAAEAARTEDYISVYGYEMTWSGGPGHMNTFATEGFVSRNNKELNNKTSDAGMRAYYDLLKQTPESISQFNHPGKTFGTFSGYAYYDPIIDERVTLIEVGNGEGAVGGNAYFPSYEEYTAALDKGWHLAPTNNQDNHKKGWGTSNTARTAIYTDDLSVDGLYEALRERRVYSTEDNNLDIVYTLNDEVLGSIVGEVPEQANFRVSVNDPDESDAIKSIEIITNGGKVVDKQTFADQNVEYEYTLDNPKAGYYYIKVVQADNHIAVTAPIWLGQDVVVGISKVESSVSMPVTNESLTLTTELFNNENESVVLKSIAYDYKNGSNIGTYSLDKTMDSNTNYQHQQNLTPTQVGEHTVVVTAVIQVKGEETTFKAEISLNVKDADKLTYVGIDAAHYNEYVTGNYKASMGNFGKLAEEYDVRTVELPTSKDLLKALENPKYEMMVLTVPSRRDGSTGRKPYAVYSNEEIEAIAKFAAEGKTVVVAGWSDYYENYANLADMPEDEHMAAQQNKLLEAMGASLRISDDGSLDDTNNGGQSPRLYLTDHNNYVSPLTKGIVEGQVFSQYGGATIHAVDESGIPVDTLPENVIPIISGHGTTYSLDQDKDGLGGSTVPRYNDRVLLMASETLTHANGMTSEVIVAGAAFMSNFEIQAEIDNNDSKNYSNYNILENLIKTLSPQEVTPIASIKNAPEGTQFTIEGMATSSVYEGSDNNKGFFDCIYAEDETGGINLFPVSSGVQAGQKIRVTGTISGYQGETQLKVARVDVIDEDIHPVEPTQLSTKEAMQSKYTGRLVEVTGVVEEVVVDEGVVNQIMINDGSGPARVYINGYITKDVSLDFVEVGQTITAVGLASIGENESSETEFLPRLRVRDRGEIRLAGEPEQPSDNALLSTLQVSKGTLQPIFEANVFKYNVEVSNDVEEITLTAVAADSKATVVGIGTKTLEVGENTFEVVIAAEDGKTMQTYTVVITRADEETDPEQPSDNALLSTLKVSTGTLQPAFKPDVFKYNVAVGNSIQKLTLSAAAADSKATVVGTGDKALKVGENTFEVVVTAEDSKTTLTYTVVVKRASSESTDDDDDDSSSSSTTSTKRVTATEAIKKLSKTQKEAIHKNIAEHTPYTSLGGLTVSQLDVLTNGKFTTAQLKEMLAKPEILKGLGIELDALGTSITLVPVKDATFTDVASTHWAYASIRQAASLGLVAGRPDGTFGPSEVLKVADTFTFLDRLLLLHGKTDMKLPRSTVEAYINNPDHWAFASMASVGSKLHEPTLQTIATLGEEVLTRELLAQVIYEVTEGQLKATQTGVVFSDIAQSPYQEALMYCAQTGVLNGVEKDKMCPEKALTRAELMTVLVRLNALLK